LKTTCVQWEGFDPNQNKALLPGVQPRQDTVVKKGDVLLTRAGPVNRVGVACQVKGSFPKLMLSDKIVRLRPKPGLNATYLVAYLATPYAQEYFRLGKTGLADSQVNISREKLLQLPIFVPNIIEQLAIEHRIERFRARFSLLMSNRQTLSAELDALVPAILDRAFKGAL
jgi:type I restriction enzyme S subunit